MSSGASERLLLVNIGNSRCALVAAEGRRFVRLAEAPSADAQPGCLLAAARTGRWDGSVLCSVRPSDNDRWQKALRRRIGVEPIVIAASLPLGLPLRYPRPETLGADRLCNACAAAARFGAPVAALDFGTAVTCDVVDERGAFIGGLIAPGWRMMADALHTRTALLPRVEPRLTRRPIGRSTTGALQLGLSLVMEGLIQMVVARLRRRFGSGLRLCATGGDLPSLRPLLRRAGIVSVPFLTFEGMRLIYQRMHARGERP